MERKELTSKKEDEEIKSLALELYAKQQRFKRVEKQYNEQKIKIQDLIREYIDKSKCSYITFKSGTTPFKVQNVKQRKVVFDVEKLESKLPKEVLNEVVIKEYKISDFKGLVKYLKSCGVDPGKFKQFVDVEKVVDKDKIDRLGEQGVINSSDLKGCYTIYENAGYIKVTELEE